MNNLVAIAGTPENARAAARAAGPLLDHMGGPLGLVGRTLGFAPGESVPGWAWFGVGALAGAVVMHALHDKFQAFVEG